MWFGFRAAAVGHALTVLVPVVPALAFAQPEQYGSDETGLALYLVGAAGMQVVLGLAVLVGAVVRFVRRDRGQSLGLIAGWLACGPVTLFAGAAIAAFVIS